MIISFLSLILGLAVAQLVETLRYHPEGRKYDSRWGQFFIRTMAVGST
jgi:hypothetical protein